MDAFISGGTREERKNRKKERKEKRRRRRIITSSDSDSSDDANIQVYWGLLQRQQAMAQIGRYFAKIQQYRESVAKKDKKDEKVTGNTSLSKIKNSTVENQVQRNLEKSSTEYSEDSVSDSEEYLEDFETIVDYAGMLEGPYELHTDESGNKQYELLETKQYPYRDRENQAQKEEEKVARETNEIKRVAEEQAEAQRVAKEKAEIEERERAERERAERERVEKERAERERVEKEIAERERVAKQQAAQAKAKAKAKAPAQASAQIVIQREHDTLKPGFNAYEANMSQKLLEIKTRIDTVKDAIKHIEDDLDSRVHNGDLRWIRGVITRCELNHHKLTTLFGELNDIKSNMGSQEQNKVFNESVNISINEVSELITKTENQIELAKQVIQAIHAEQEAKQLAEQAEEAKKNAKRAERERAERERAERERAEREREAEANLEYTNNHIIELKDILVDSMKIIKQNSVDVANATNNIDQLEELIQLLRQNKFKINKLITNFNDASSFANSVIRGNDPSTHQLVNPNYEKLKKTPIYKILIKNIQETNELVTNIRKLAEHNLELANTKLNIAQRQAELAQIQEQHELAKNIEITKARIKEIDQSIAANEEVIRKADGQNKQLRKFLKNTYP